MVVSTICRGRGCQLGGVATRMDASAVADSARRDNCGSWPPSHCAIRQEGHDVDHNKAPYLRGIPRVSQDPGGYTSGTLRWIERLFPEQDRLGIRNRPDEVLAAVAIRINLAEDAGGPK